MDDNTEFQNELEEVDDIIYEEVFPILERIEEEYPEQSAFFNVFINSMHVVFMQGWSKADVLQEVEDHYEIYLENAAKIQNDMMH